MKGVLVLAALVAGALGSGCPAGPSSTLLADSRACAGFWRCVGGQPLFHACPRGLHFSARLQRCTLPVFARCQALPGDSPVHTGFMSGLLETLRHVISSKAQPVPPVEDELSAPPELPSGDLADEEDIVRLNPNAEADVADNGTEGAEKSKENEEQKSADKGEENELDTMEEKKREEQEEDGKERDDSERPEEKIEREEDETDGDKEESEEKINEISEDIAAENDGANKQDSKKDATVLKKKKEEEEEDDNKKKSKDVKRIEKESKKNKPEEMEKDSESDAESDDE